jgi:hypothetical protein
MKFYISLIVLMMITSFAFLYGQVPYSNENEPVSFRSLSLGGIINDDLDLVYDPIELRFVDSLRLYTNLSNLTNYNERVFDNYGDNEFLLGASRQNPWWDKHWMSAIVQFDKSKDITENFTEHIDLADLVSPYGGTYTAKRTVSDKTSYADRPDFYAFQLNNTILLQDLTVGLKIGYGNYGNERLQSDHSFSPGEGWYPFSGFNYNHSSFDHVDEIFYTDSIYQKWGEHGKFNTKYDEPAFNANGSVMMPMSGYELRGDLMFSSYDYTSNTNDVYDADWSQPHPHVANYSNMRTIHEGYKYDWEQNGSRFGFGLSARKTFDKQAERKNDGFVSLGVAFMFGSYDYKSKSDNPQVYHQRYSDGTNAIYNYDELTTYNYLSSNNGDGTDNAFIINAKFNIPLTDGVHFGIGGSYSYYSSDRTTKDNWDYSQVRTYEVLDNVANHNDVTYTATQGITSSVEYKYTDGEFMFPVGIEYKFTENKRWALRVGTVFHYYNYTQDSKDNVTESRPPTEKYEYKDGIAITDISSNSYYQSQTYHYEYARSYKNMYYGLGFNATDNLQIDAMGFFNLEDVHVWSTDFFKNLRLSFVMKF